MNNSVKDQILSRLREEKSIQLPQKHSNNGRRIWPTWDLGERVSIFKKQMRSVRTELHESSSENCFDLVREMLETKGISSLIHGTGKSYSEKLETLRRKLPDLQLIQPEEVEKGFKERLFSADAALTEAKAGIAETGTLVLWPDRDEPRLISLVPPIHIVLLDRNKIYNSFKEIISKEGWKDSLPTNALLISGPSKTADIEFSLAYGIHGPCELIVLLID